MYALSLEGVHKQKKLDHSGAVVLHWLKATKLAHAH
jgi:hypothetical protein